MTRILVLDDAAASFAAVGGLLASAGYDAVHADSGRRLVLEMRAAPAQLLLALADMSNGTGLELVRDAYHELEEPLPVVAWSRHMSRAELLEQVPVSLNLAALVAQGDGQAELLRAVLSNVASSDPGLAGQVLADSEGEEAVGEWTVERTLDLSSCPADVFFADAERQGWSGALRYQPSDSSAATVSCRLSAGRLCEIHSDRPADLVETARAQGRLEGITLPDVALASQDEEVGLLMAMRALGTHEVEQLKTDTQARLVGLLLDAGEGALSCTPETDSASAEPSRALLPLLLEARRERQGDASAGGLLESELSVTLPARGAGRGLATLDRELLQGLAAVAGKRITLAGFLDRFAAGDQQRRDHAVATLSQLRALGYVAYGEALFPADVAATLSEMTVELHKWSRSNHFEVLGAGKEASDADLRDRMRKLSLVYHPDRQLGAHPRVQQLAESMYARVQDAFAAVETPDLRSEYRARLRSEDTGESATGRDQGSAQVAMAQAAILLRQKRYADAAGLYRDATLHDTGNAEAHMWFGWCSYLADHGTVDVATTELTRALELNGRLIDSLFYLGRVQLLEKNFDQARDWFKKAADSPSGHPEAARELRLMHSRGLGLTPEEAAERSEQDNAKSSGKGLFGRFRRN